MIDPSTTSLGQGAISNYLGFGLWQMFKTVVLLEEQVRARDDPRLGALLDRVRAGTQTHQDLLMLNTRLVDRDQVSFSTGLRAITPLNRNRWSLSIEAVVDWARSHKRHISIFISAHTWRSDTLSEDQIARTIELGDDSSCKVPGVFFYAQGMPVVVNQNIYTGLKIVNGAEFTAYDFVPDPKYPGFHLADDVTIHFGPPLGIILHSKDTTNLSIPTLPPGTVLVRSVLQTLDPSKRNYPFLMHAVLACSALHLATKYPWNQEYFVTAHSHQNIAMSMFREAVTNVTEANCHAIAGFSHLLVVYSLGSEKQDESLLFTDTASTEPDLLCSWLYFIRNGCTLVQGYEITLLVGLWQG